MKTKEMPARAGVKGKPGSPMRLAAWAAPLALLLAAGCGGDSGNANGSAMRGGIMAVQVHVLAPGSLSNVVATSGTLLANEQVDLQSEVDGRVSAISFQEGTPVKAGQVLVRINDDDLQAQLRKARADLQLAQATAERQARLLEVKGISQEAFDATRAQLAGKQAEVDNLQALIAKTTIRAPFSGVIGLRHISVGSFVAPNTLIASLSQLDPVKLDFSLPERYGRLVKKGNPVEFTLEGDTAVHEAVIYAMDPGVNADTRTVRVRARTANADGKLVPGAFARVRVDLGTIPDALTIPSEGLIPDISGQVVMLMRGGKAVTARVEVGQRTEEQVQLISGVQAGDTVITSGLLAVREGMPVSPARPKSTAGDTAAEAGNE